MAGWLADVDDGNALGRIVDGLSVGEAEGLEGPTDELQGFARFHLLRPYGNEGSEFGNVLLPHPGLGIVAAAADDRPIVPEKRGGSDTVQSRQPPLPAPA